MANISDYNNILIKKLLVFYKDKFNKKERLFLEFRQNLCTLEDFARENKTTINKAKEIESNIFKKLIKLTTGKGRISVYSLCRNCDNRL